MSPADTTGSFHTAQSSVPSSPATTTRRPASATQSSRPGSASNRPVLEPIKSAPHKIAATGTLKPSANRPRQTSITVVEPIRENRELGKAPTKKEQSTAKKTLKLLGDGLGVVCYMLCICCVLSGEQRPQAKKTRQGYYYQYDDCDSAEMDGPRVRKVESRGAVSVGSKARSERIERA